MNLLGISAFTEAAGAGLVRDGIPVAAVREETLSGRRGDPSFPRRSIEACLRIGEVAAKDLDAVVFFEKPLRKFERILVSQLRAFPRSAKTFPRELFLWLGDRLWLKGRIASEVGVDASRVLFVEHARAQAAAAFYPSPFEEAAILVADRGGEWATTVLGRGRGSDLETLSEIRFPHSLGLLSATLARFLGLAPDEGEEEMAALAAYGEPRFEPQLASLVHHRGDGSFELDLEAFRFPFDSEKPYDGALEKILGEPRMPGGPLRRTGADRRDADLAASWQRVLESALLDLLKELRRRVPSENLVLAGSLSRNVVANARCLRDGPFRRLHVAAAPGEAGAALGAALAVAHGVLGAPRRSVPADPFLGEPLAEEPGEGARRLGGDDAVVEALVDRLSAGKLVGWVRGRGEWGVRSLGHRCVLADARRPEAAAEVSERVTRRESFLPYAPAIAEERSAEVLDLPAGAAGPARCKMIAAAVRPQAREAMPAALHVDGTARPLLVSRAVDPLFHRVLSEFGSATGAPALLMTSLRLRGDPTVRGEADALALFGRSSLDALIVEDRIYDRG